MAKYTMLFAEYLKSGRQLPSAFSLIPALNEISFEDLFISRFCQREIGFETDSLFEIKLNARANVVCPFYADKLKLLSNYTPQKIYDAATVEKVENDYGREDKHEFFVNPDNASTTDDIYKIQSMTNAERFKASNKDEATKTNSGQTTENAFATFEKIKRDKVNVYEELLNEFDSLFMGVF